MKILILTIATNKYIQFVERLYDNIEDLEVTFSKFYATLDQYDPKAFIKDNLSFECSVKTLLDILT